MGALIKTFENVGLNWAVPFLRLARRENPNEQIREILRNIGIPILAVLIFLAAWSWVAANVKVSFGSLPGPTAVLIQAKSLWAGHLAQRAKESEFYQRQAVRKKEFLAQNPGGKWEERKFAGAPTYIDQIFTTTIDQTPFDVTGLPLTNRARKAIQYGDSIDAVVKLLAEKNNGLYANEWLIGDLKTNEIAMFELGTKATRLWRSSKNQWFEGTKGWMSTNSSVDLPGRRITT